MLSDRFKLPQDFTRNADAVTIQVYDNEVERKLLENIFLLNHPKDIAGLHNPVSIEHSIVAAGDRADIRLTSDQLALFVVLTSRAQGRFSENGFVLKPGEEKVSIISFETYPLGSNAHAGITCDSIQTIVFRPMTKNGNVNVTVLRRSLRVEHLGFYLARSHDGQIYQDAKVEKYR